MFYAVSRYQDTYTAKDKKPAVDDAFGRLMYFDSEDEARAFMQDRAWRGVQAAEKALKLAQQRLKKCQKKFPVRITLPEYPWTDSGAAAPDKGNPK